MQVTRSQAIKDYLDKNTWPDLAALYHSGMECQVNVAQDGGDVVLTEYQGRNKRNYTDAVQTWGPFRIPRNSMTEPEDNDFNISFDLALHVDGIGLTGWDWKAKRSRHVAFDFDAIVGHSEKHSKKMSAAELEAIKQKIMGIEWATLRKSTGGQGLHVYVFLDFEDTINNHTEHMAVGRAILSQLSAIATFDFESKVDTNAGNMWIWHRKLILPDGSRNPDGLALIKQGSKLKDIPQDWRDHVDVVTGKRKRAIPFFIKGDDDPQKALDEFEELSSQRPKVPLDPEHEKLLAWIRDKAPGGSWWREDHWMLVTHTHTLKEAHTALRLRGPFDTVATGSDRGADWNCYAFPLLGGSWVVRRYTRGCAEFNTWDQDGKQYTTCYLNRFPDFKLACKLNGGIERPAGGWAFTQAKDALACAKMLGNNELSLPEHMQFRSAILKQHKDKRLIIEVTKDASDNGVGMNGYDGTGKGKTWNQIVEVKTEPAQNFVDLGNMDKLIRHVVNEGNRDEGWVLKSDGHWNDEPIEHIKYVLRGPYGHKPNEVDQILGASTMSPYKLINRPFDVEYPPGRLWNRKGAKLAFAPSLNIDNLQYPTWQKIMNHLGQNINGAIKNHPWAKANGILTGADYLTLWIAAVFQEPYQRLPYLFLFSEEEDTGKSTYHNAISLLMEGDPPRGTIKVDEALKANATFNAELQHAILCVIEELNLSPRATDAKISHNRIKELVTANTISIHEKNQTPCMVRNTTHWIHCTNNRLYCPVFKGDTRITVIKVNPLDDIDKIPQFKLMEMLKKEGPDFLAHILRLEIPPANDRLLLPVIETQDKQMIQSSNLTTVEAFIAETCHVVDGESILWADFYDDFQKWMDADDCQKWTKRYTGFHLPDYHPRGRRKVDNQYVIANLSRHARAPETNILPRLVLKGDRLIPEDIGASDAIET